jgi:hypothetical protein
MFCSLGCENLSRLTTQGGPWLQPWLEDMLSSTRAVFVADSGVGFVDLRADRDMRVLKALRLVPLNKMLALHEAPVASAYLLHA